MKSKQSSSLRVYWEKKSLTIQQRAEFTLKNHTESRQHEEHVVYFTLLLLKIVVSVSRYDVIKSKWDSQCVGGEQASYSLTRYSSTGPTSGRYVFTKSRPLKDSGGFLFSERKRFIRAAATKRFSSFDPDDAPNEAFWNFYTTFSSQTSAGV